MAKKCIVIFSPHPDDAEFGAWGYLNQNRHEEITVVLVSGVVDRLHEATLAISELGANVIGLGQVDGSIEANPELVGHFERSIAVADLVLGPYPDDTHRDHREVGMALKAAVRRKKIDVLFYGTPSTEFSFVPNVFLPLSGADRGARADVLAKHESQRHQEYFTPQYLEAKDRFWGYRVGVEFAEPFVAYKLLL